MSATGRPGDACPGYWRIYLAWVAVSGQQAAVRWQLEPRRAAELETLEREERRKLAEHIIKCGCRLGLGRANWNPMDEPIHDDEKAGGWDVQS